jgi:hypothetical protein
MAQQGVKVPQRNFALHGAISLPNHPDHALKCMYVQQSWLCRFIEILIFQKQIKFVFFIAFLLPQVYADSISTSQEKRC